MSGTTPLPGALQKLLQIFGGNRLAAAAFLQGKPSGLPAAMQQAVMGAIGHSNVPALLTMLGVPGATQAPGGFGSETDPASVGLAGNPGGTYRAPDPPAAPTPATPAASPTAPAPGATGAGLPPLFNLGSESSPESAGLPANPGGTMTSPTSTTTPTLTPPTGGLGSGNNSLYGAYLGTKPDKLERAVLQAMGADPDRLGQYGNFIQSMIHPLVQASAEFLPFAEGTGNNGFLDPTGVQGWAQHFADQMRTPGVDAFAGVRDWIGKVVGGAGFQAKMNMLPDEGVPGMLQNLLVLQNAGAGGLRSAAQAQGFQELIGGAQDRQAQGGVPGTLLQFLNQPGNEQYRTTLRGLTGF